MSYVCTKCETQIDDLEPVDEKIICPMCSARTVLKLRPEEPTPVKAR